jgi:type II secretory pathway pseudopilin PulG
MKDHGTSLLELMLAIALIVVIVTMVSLTLPKASQSISVSRERLQASSFANAEIQFIKAQPYATIVPNAQSNFGSVPNCNCNAANLSWSGVYVPSPTDTMVDSSITYTRYLCINLVQPPPSFSSDCPDGPPVTSASDHGLKNVRVHVTWSVFGTAYSTDAESLVTR